MLHDWRGLDDADRGAAVALGFFDGVHTGHRRVIAAAAEAARVKGAPLGVITFEPHPRRWFHPDAAPFRLQTPDQKARALAGLGVERLYVLPFDADLAALPAEAFVRRVLCEGLGVAHAAVGFDFAFGQGRSGGPQTLRALAGEGGYGVTVVEPVLDADGRKQSSSRIRALIAEGRVEDAARLLGRPFAIEGVVVHGDKLGRTIGFPTANMELGDYVRPAAGIYATRTRLPDGREVAGVAYCGRRPTVNGVDERFEVNLFDFDEDLYGQTLETDLVAQIRGDRKFDSLEAMVAQMNADCAAARARLLPPL